MKKGEADRTPLSVTASEASQKAQKSGDTGKLQGDSTTFPTLTSKPSEQVKNNRNDTQNCGCPNKRDAFFEKLINYLEKQSDVISRCCFNDKSTSVRNKRLNTDPIFNKEESPCSNNSTTLSDKSKPKDHRSEDKLSRSHKSKDNECKIIVEVCTCDKNKNTVKPTASSKSLKPSAQNQSENGQARRNVANEIDCSGCEKKVDNFFKLAEEICQAYLKRCLMNDDLNNMPSQYSEQSLKVEDLDGMNAPQGQRRGYQEPTQERADNRDVGGCNSLAVEIECHGDREEFVIQPCDCVRKSGRPSHYPSRMSQDETRRNQSTKKRCVDVFEERYGQILRDLHSKLIKHNQQPGMGNPPPPGAQQQYPAPQQPTYPPPQQQQPPSQNQPNNSRKQPPQNATQPGQYPPYQNQYPQTNPQYQPYPSGMPPYYGQPPDATPPVDPVAQEQNDKPSKSSNKGKNKKKS